MSVPRLPPAGAGRYASGMNGSPAPVPSPPPGRYDTVARIFHWTVAGLLLFQIPLAWIMTDQPLGPDKLENYALHKSIGITLFGLTALRLAWRLTHPAPPLPAGTPDWQRWLARLNQGLLYFILFAMPLTGWLMSSAANMPVSFFGLFTLPDLVAPDEVRARSFAGIHEGQGTALMVLILLHALAALHHHLIRRDGILASMLPGLRPR
jgi:cytochrome b561